MYKKSVFLPKNYPEFACFSHFGLQRYGFFVNLQNNTIIFSYLTANKRGLAAESLCRVLFFRTFVVTIGRPVPC